MKRAGIFSLIVSFSALLVGSCSDTNIEGAASVTSGFKIDGITYSYISLNLGSCTGGSPAKSGTNFTIVTTYSGSEKITSIKETYKFISGTTSGTPTTVTLIPGSDYIDKPPVAGSFRTGSSSSVTRTRCAYFGTNTALQLDYVITTLTTTTPPKTYNTTITITKPTGAN